MRDIETRKFYRLLYPTVPAILAASDGSTVSAMPVVSLTMLSESPPLVGVSSAPSHSTFKTVRESKSFSLSWLDKKFMPAMEALAKSSGAEGADKLMRSGLPHQPGKKLRVPVPDSSSAVLECRLAGSRRFGDHVLLVGRVVAAYASRDFQEYWRYREYRPILYSGWQGGLATYNRSDTLP